MIQWKTIGKKLLFPPLWLILFLATVSAAGLIAVFVKGWDTSPIAYAVYVLAFYALSVLTVRFTKCFPAWKKTVKQKVYNNQYANRYITDVQFKTHVSLYLSLTANLLYAALNILSVILYRSMWFAILAGYYMILAIMRFLLVRYVNRAGIGKDRIGELKRSRLCASILLTLNLVLSGAVLMILYQNRGFEYNGILIYVMAAYTFYVTTHSVINIIKYRQYHSPVMSTARSINLTAALVSMLSLETAMLSQFGTDSTPEFRRIMVATTGAGVSLIVLTLSAYIIIKSTSEIRRNKKC